MHGTRDYTFSHGSRHTDTDIDTLTHCVGLEPIVRGASYGLDYSQHVGLDKLEYVRVVAWVDFDGLAEVGPGGRHALAAFVMYCAAAERLNAAVAEQAAELYSIAAVAQDVKQSLTVGTPKHEAWLDIVKVLATLNPDNA